MGCNRVWLNTGSVPFLNPIPPRRREIAALWDTFNALAGIPDEFRSDDESDQMQSALDRIRELDGEIREFLPIWGGTRGEACSCTDG
jgi:hypothetical protein